MPAESPGLIYIINPLYINIVTSIKNNFPEIKVKFQYKNDIILHLCNWSLIDASASNVLQYVILVNVYQNKSSFIQMCSWRRHFN